MKHCPRCDRVTRVVNTRYPYPGNENDPRQRAFLKRGSDLIGWYTMDYLMRSRVCGCGWAAETIELSVEDLSSVMDEAEEGHRGDHHQADLPEVKAMRNLASIIKSIVWLATISREK